jgi:hypothetical protein
MSRIQGKRTTDEHRLTRMTGENFGLGAMLLFIEACLNPDAVVVVPAATFDHDRKKKTGEAFD